MSAFYLGKRIATILSSVWGMNNWHVLDKLLNPCNKKKSVKFKEDLNVNGLLKSYFLSIKMFCCLHEHRNLSTWKGCPSHCSPCVEYHFPPDWLNYRAAAYTWCRVCISVIKVSVNTSTKFWKWTCPTLATSWKYNIKKWLLSFQNEHFYSM